jgi:carboxyl-terminal processing protease
MDKGELYAPDSSLFVDSLKYKTPKGKIVYGGGGIMPDVFVPFDSTGNSWYFSDLRFSGAFQAFAFDYVSDKRQKWNSPQDFDQQFIVSDDLIERFAQFAAKEMKVKTDRSGLKHSKDMIRRQIKAEIARQIWLEDGFYRVVNQKDKEVQRALSVFK